MLGYQCFKKGVLNMNRFLRRQYVIAFTVLFALLTPLGVCQHTFAQADFDEMVTFGDSLTHNDILWLAYGTWADLYQEDPFEAAFDKGASGGDILTTYAVAGSESSDVSYQIGVYEFMNFLGIQGDATLIGYEIGGNNILNNIGTLKAYAPGENGAADGIIDDLLGDMRSDLIGLRKDHKRAEFILWTIPDVTQTPDHYGTLTTEEENNVRAHIDRVNQLIRNAEHHSFIAVVDVYEALNDAIEELPVLHGQTLIGPPAKGDYDHLFADEIHPTAVMNAMLANEIIAKITDQFGNSIPFYSEDELAEKAHIE